MNISDFIQPRDIVVDLSVVTKLRTLELLSAKAADATGLDGKAVLAALGSREKLGSTGIGDGIALPHARLEGVRKPFGLMARLTKAVDFEAIDDVPVDLVFVVLLPENRTGEHLNVLASIARHMRADHIVRTIRKAASADEIYVTLTTDAP